MYLRRANGEDGNARGIHEEDAVGAIGVIINSID